MANYTMCEYPGCRRKGEAHYQAVGRDGPGELFDLCAQHLCHGEKEVLRGLTDELRKNKYRKSMAQAQIKKKSEKQQEVIKSSKDTLTLANYAETTGKRFRMTKAQKQRGLSREEAFNEIMEGV